MKRVVSEPTEEFLRALGGVVVNFAALEESLHDAILEFARSECDSQGRSVNVLTARMSFRTLVDSFGALCTDLGSRPEAGDPIKFCGRLNDLNDERNQVTHSTWAFLPPIASYADRSGAPSRRPDSG